MTNATVADAVTAVDGRTVALTYDDGQEMKLSIPDGTPIVTFIGDAGRPRAGRRSLRCGRGGRRWRADGGPCRGGQPRVAPPM